MAASASVSADLLASTWACASAAASRALCTPTSAWLTLSCSAWISLPRFCSF
jgi:hypothetical protein